MVLPLFKGYFAFVWQFYTEVPVLHTLDEIGSSRQARAQLLR